MEGRMIGPAPAMVIDDGLGGVHERLRHLWHIDPARRWGRTTAWRCLSPVGTVPDDEGAVLVQASEGVRVVQWDLDGPVPQQGSDTVQPGSERLMSLVPGDLVVDTATGAPVAASDPVTQLLAGPAGAWARGDLRVEKTHGALVASTKDEPAPRLSRAQVLALAQLRERRTRQAVLEAWTVSSGDSAAGVPVELVRQLFGQVAVRKDVVRLSAQLLSAHQVLALELARTLWLDELPVDWLAKFLESLQNAGSPAEQLRRVGPSALPELLAGIDQEHAPRLRRKLLLKDLTTRSGAEAGWLVACARAVAVPEVLTDPEAGPRALSKVGSWRELARALGAAARTQRLAVLGTDVRAQLKQDSTHGADGTTQTVSITTERATEAELRAWHQSPGHQGWLRARAEAGPVQQELAHPVQQDEQQSQSHKESAGNVGWLSRTVADQLRAQLDGHCTEDLRYKVAIHPEELQQWHQELGHCIDTYDRRLSDPMTLLVGVYELPAGQLSSTMEIVVNDNCTVRIAQDQGAVSKGRNAPHRKQNRETVASLLGPGLLS